MGQVLNDVSPQGFNAIFERFRGILHEGEIDKRVQYTIEKLFDAYRKKFSDFPGVIPELDLVEEEDQITHELDLLDASIKGDEMLNIFKPEEPQVWRFFIDCGLFHLIERCNGCFVCRCFWTMKRLGRS